MFFSIFSFLLDVVAGVVGGACLLRLYMQWVRVPFANPLGQLVMALTSWIVLPLRRWLPIGGKLDLASLVAAFLMELAQFGLLWGARALLGGFAGGMELVPVLAVFGLVRLVISGLTGLLIVYAVMSWVQTHSVLFDTVERLCQPLLRPVRRFMPLIGGVDLSPLVALVLLQVAAMVLSAMQMTLLH